MNRVSETEKPYQAVTRDSLRTSIDFFFLREKMLRYELTGRQVHLCACTHPCTTNFVYSSAKTPFQMVASCQKIYPKMEK